MERMVCIFFLKGEGGGGGGEQGANKVPCCLSENGEQSLFHVTSLPPC